MVEGKTNSLLRVFDVPLFGFRNSVEKFCDSWVQTRRYVALVVSVPIPLRTQQTGVPTRRKAFLRNYGKQKKCQRTLDTNEFLNLLSFSPKQW